MAEKRQKKQAVKAFEKETFSKDKCEFPYKSRVMAT